jgi:hypothetical protein
MPSGCIALALILAGAPGKGQAGIETGDARGGPEDAGRQALVLAKTLTESQDWEARIRAAWAIAEHGPGAAPAASALIEALGWRPHRDHDGWETTTSRKARSGPS